MKRFAVWAIVVAFVFALVSPVQAASAEVKVVLNGEELSFDVAPYVEDNRTLVPVRGVFEKLGLVVSWNQQTQTATILNDDTKITMELGEKNIKVNGQTVQLDTAVTMKKNRLFIPLRYVSETGAGADVSWDQASQTVTITKGTELSEEEVEAVLADLAKVELNSFSANMDIKQTMNMLGEEITADMSFDMDMVMDPLGLYQAMSMTMEELSGEAMEAEFYLTQDGSYAYDSFTDQWVKYEDEFTEELLNLSGMQLDPEAQYEMMAKFYEHVTIIENDDTYVLNISVSGDQFQELLEEILNLSDLGLGEEMDDLLGELDLTINKMEIVEVLDKETLYPISGKMISDIEMGMEGETMSIQQDVTYKYSNVNELTEIVVPQEVIDSAIPADELEVEEIDAA